MTTTTGQPATGDDRVFTEETWTFGGLRIDAKGRRRHAWADPSGEELWYSARGHPVIGGRYIVEVSRDGGRCTRRTGEQFTGERADEARTAQLELADRAANARLAELATERAAARKSALARAITPIRRLAVEARTTGQRDALASACLAAIYGTDR